MRANNGLESIIGRRRFLKVGVLLGSSGLLFLVGCEGGSTFGGSGEEADIIRKGKGLLEESKKNRREPLYIEHTTEGVNEGIHGLNSIGEYRAEINGDRAVFYAEGTDTCESRKEFYKKAGMPDEFPVIYSITHRFVNKNGEWVEFGGFRMEQMEKDEEYWRKKRGE